MKNKTSMIAACFPTLSRTLPKTLQTACWISEVRAERSSVCGLSLHEQSECKGLSVAAHSYVIAAARR